MFGFQFDDEEPYIVANSRKGLYSQCNRDVINYILSPKVLGMKLKCKGESRFTRDSPLAYYLNKVR